ncbi:MAG: AAA family ATPase [Deltaproteobacteria bacterium]|jgi:protein phosphatase|nr:AAA family ATPase [Deltaproteobacteria bacterium]
MLIKIPEISVVALVGASGSGKSTFARKHFLNTEVLSSDYFRGLVSDDESNQEVTPQAFETLYFIAHKRLDFGRLVVIDATNVQKASRSYVVRLARAHECQAAAIVFDLPEGLCLDRNGSRPSRTVPGQIVSRQCLQLKHTMQVLRKEGFRYVYVLKSQEDVEGAEIARVTSRHLRRWEAGPFDVIGDLHGCFDELRALLEKLGYSVGPDGRSAVPPDGRRAVFLGGLCGNGPKNVPVLRLVMGMVRDGAAYCLEGGRDVKLLDWLMGSGLRLQEDLGPAVKELALAGEGFTSEARAFLGGLDSHYVFDGGGLVVAHAGLKEKYQGRDSGRVRNFCLYGDAYEAGAAEFSGARTGERAGGRTGEKGGGRAGKKARWRPGEADGAGPPAHSKWTDEYSGKALVVYGHGPVPEPVPVNNTVCIDTGCAFGGKLTAYRYPEGDFVQVDALAPPSKPSDTAVPSNPSEVSGPSEASGHSEASAQSFFAAPPDRSKPSGPSEPAASPERPEPSEPSEPSGPSGAAPGGPPADAPSAVGGNGGSSDSKRQRSISTRLLGDICFGDDSADAALAAMGRVASDPRWLIYLPPAVPRCTAGRVTGFQEHPSEAFGYYKSRGVQMAVCEEERAGSRAVISLCRDAKTASRRFGVGDGSFGIVHDRAGRGFFGDPGIADSILERLHEVLDASGFWERFCTGWVCLECELVPLAPKVRWLKEGLRDQPGLAGRPSPADPQGAGGGGEAAPAKDGSAGGAGDPASASGGSVEWAGEGGEQPNPEPKGGPEGRGARGDDLESRVADRRFRFREVKGLEDCLVAPFHVLATEGRVWSSESHLWHLKAVTDFVGDSDPVFARTDNRLVVLGDEGSVSEAVRWWEGLAGFGGRGMVVKPIDFVPRKGEELLLPAILCRESGRLGIISGPSRREGDVLARPDKRELERRRALALREFALGMESLERFVGKDTPGRVAECVLGVLALESESVGPWALGPEP